MSQYTTRNLEHYWAKIRIPEDTNACWVWTGSRERKVWYGMFRAEGRTLKAHRIAWELANGPIPTGMHVLHKCDNPACCNPAHLFLGTNTDNVRDRHAKGRTAHHGRLRGEDCPQSKLTEDQVVEILRRKGEPSPLVAADYEVSPRAIRMIWERRNWRHVTVP